MSRPDALSGARLATLSAHRALATVAAVAVGLGTLAAACAPAPGRPGSTPVPLAPLTDVQAALDAAGATGPAVAVWVWTPGFVAGDPGAEPLRHARTWVAPTGPVHAPTGTVTVWQDPAGDGTVERAAVDGDTHLAAALRTLSPDATLVTDRSDWLVVEADRVRSVLPPDRTELTGTVTVAGYRALLAARAAADAPGDAPGDDTVGG